MFGDRAMRLIAKFLRSEEAATAVEYAVILMLILLVVLSGVRAVGSRTADLWDGIVNSVDASQSSPGQ
jgi:pilus assembly protein Flp/PilA